MGKSTLIGALVRHLRAAGDRVAVVSVDPTSPFTRGAVLGDRIRLTDHFLDPGVFIRSMASRGHLGGLAEATADAVLVLDAAGYDVVLVETVGSGQNEVEVQALTETVLLVLMPGSGDSIQALKAGLMEIPDLLVINKADRPGADLLRAELEATLSLVPSGPWRPPDRQPPGRSTGDGVAELWAQVGRHREFLAGEGRLASAGARAWPVSCARWPSTAWRAGSTPRPQPAFLDGLIEQVLDRDIDPATAVDRVLERVSPPSPAGPPARR